VSVTYVDSIGAPERAAINSGAFPQSAGRAFRLTATNDFVPGIRVGHCTDARALTGCTVVLCEPGAVAGVDVRGSAPGTRETDALRPGNAVTEAQAVLLTGGSAFGLDAASGVVGYLADLGIGFKVGPATVPIVPAAILFDLGLITSDVRPGPQEGLAACLAADTAPMDEGSLGAGTGATVAKGRGMAGAVKSGIGSASLTLTNGPTVAVNAYGGIFDYQTGRLIAGPRRDDGSGFHDPMDLAIHDEPSEEDSLLANTTIGVVATDASLTREEANFLAGVSHDGLALSIRPCHTIRDGDTTFALATGRIQHPVELTRLGTAAVEVTARAVLRAVQTSTGLGGIPAVSELEDG
jgi:L-aminopeptidase/D-esterase-like protein